jgi:hypothetical protein
LDGSGVCLDRPWVPDHSNGLSAMMYPRIHTLHEWPSGSPYPFWRAWDDNLGEDFSPYGEGATEQEAIEDLEWQLAELAYSRRNNDDGVYAK